MCDCNVTHGQKRKESKGRARHFNYGMRNVYDVVICLPTLIHIAEYKVPMMVAN